MGKKITFNRVYDYIKIQGDTLLSETYIDNKTKLEIRCKKDHIFKTSWKSYYNANSRCRICANERKKLLVSTVKNYIESTGDFLASAYVNTNTKITIKCGKCGDTFETRLKTYKKGRRCYKCFPNPKKLSIDFVRDVVEKSGDKLLSKIYIDSGSKLDIKCGKCGHIYKMVWDSYKQGHRCRECAKVRVRKSRLLDYQEVCDRVASRGDKLISKTYKGNPSKIEIQCRKCNRIFKMTLNNYSRGQECPHCRKTGFDSTEPAYLYYGKIVIENKLFYKIGVTNRNPIKRLKAEHRDFQLLWHEPYLFGSYALQKEKNILKKYSKYLLNDMNLPINNGHREIFTKDILKKDT